MKLRITIGGNTYEADVEVLEEEDLAAAPPDMVYSPRAAHLEAVAEESAGEIADRTCRSPVTGMVIRVQAEAGQAVEAGQVLVVLESMKMETRVTAPCSGTVAKVHVTAGVSVKASQPLVELA